AFDMIYRRYVRELYQSAYKRLDSRELVEDLVQDVFLKLWNRREKLRIENLGAYLHTAVRYQVLNQLTRKNALSGFYEPFDSIVPDFDTPENKLVTKEMMALVLKYVQTLPEKRKRIFLLYIETRLSVAEIADELNISTKTVYNQVGLAMDGLRTQIAPVVFALLFLHR
ncbi:MAG TPA: RNA polymerase sigma-70 factor, partial [Puia sp.]|nr:RNA polymerase sigma-70 factor [Puia sp.]